MKYLPFEHLIYTSPLDFKEVITRIERNVQPPSKAGIWGRAFGSFDRKAYEGKVENDSFHIERILNYQNGFAPQIFGVVQSEADATTIVIKMRLHLAVIVFMSIWCALSLGVLYLILHFTPADEPTSMGILFPIGMILILYIVTTLGFKYESKKSIKFFGELFEEVNPTPEV